jgi:glycosyltransferase involved in cell wall biosynthesis
MKHAAVFVLSSAAEGLPTVLIEAMACGVPVVSTDCPSGPAEILENGRFGTLVEVGEVEGMASAIIKVLDSRPDTAPARQRAQDFSFEKGIDQYYQLVNELTGLQQAFNK